MRRPLRILPEGVFVFFSNLGLSLETIGIAAPFLQIKTVGEGGMGCRRVPFFNKMEECDFVCVFHHRLDRYLV